MTSRETGGKFGRGNLPRATYATKRTETSPTDADLTSLEEGGLSSANVDITFGTPQDGKVKFTTGPKDTGAKTFFMKVKVK